MPVFAALELREKVEVAEIRSLVIETFKQAFGRWIAVPEIWRPETRETADHSLPFCVAAALIDGAITPATFEAERYRDPDVLDLMGRAEIKLSEAFAALAPAVRACRITATLSDGRTVTVEKQLGPEDDLKGMSRADLETKVHTITRPFLDDAARAALIDLVWRIEDLDSIGPLLDRTAVSAAPGPVGRRGIGAGLPEQGHQRANRRALRQVVDRSDGALRRRHRTACRKRSCGISRDGRSGSADCPPCPSSVAQRSSSIRPSRVRTRRRIQASANTFGIAGSSLMRIRSSSAVMSGAKRRASWKVSIPTRRSSSPAATPYCRLVLPSRPLLVSADGRSALSADTRP